MICPASANSLTDNSPGSKTILFLWLLPPIGGEASYVVEMSQRVSEDQKPGFNFQTLPKRNILVHFLALSWQENHWVPMKVITGQFS